MFEDCYWRWRMSRGGLKFQTQQFGVHDAVVCGGVGWMRDPARAARSCEGRRRPRRADLRSVAVVGV